jgi:hypothetical protein
VWRTGSNSTVTSSPVENLSSVCLWLSSFSAYVKLYPSYPIREQPLPISLAVYRVDVTFPHVSFGGDDAFQTHSDTYVILQFRDFEADFGRNRRRQSRLHNSQLITVAVALCSETAFRQHNLVALRSIREAVSQFSHFSHFLYFPHTLYVSHNCSESFTHRRHLLCELLQRQSVRTRHHSQSIHFAEQLVEAAACGLCRLQWLSLQ